MNGKVKAVTAAIGVPGGLMALAYMINETEGGEWKIPALCVIGGLLLIYSVVIRLLPPPENK